MWKKVVTIAAVLVLMTLVAAPWVLAQQYPTQSQPTYGGTPTSNPSSEGTPPALPTTIYPYSLDSNGNVVIDCQAAFSNLAQLELVSGSLANDPTYKSELEQAKYLAQVCVIQGYDPTKYEGGNNGMNQYGG